MAKKKLDKNMIKDISGGNIWYVYSGNDGRLVVYNTNGVQISNQTFHSIDDVAREAFGSINNNVELVVELKAGDLEILQNGGTIPFLERKGMANLQHNQ